MSVISDYLLSIQTELSTGNAKEHAYRPALKTLFESLNDQIIAVNDPTRSDHGAPDFIFVDKTNKDFILGYAEAKDVTVLLKDIENSDQLKRYMGYPQLILTNYVEFWFYRNGEKYQSISIADKKYGVIHPIESNFVILQHEIKDFLSGKPETIKSAEKLARIMGGKGRRIRENVFRFVSNDQNDKYAELFRLMETMRSLLVHDLTNEQFSDMYAQTLVYGLFVARYYDKTPDSFTRAEARDLVPASNPFLQKFFDHIGGTDFLKSLRIVTDELCSIFAVSDVDKIMKRKYDLFGETVDKDPIIHFYEDFLAEYDPDLKRKMGAYYTPVPIVEFMVKAVDEILIKEFDLSGGLADTTKITHTTQVQTTKKKIAIPKVQILDPAVGTATFLNEIIKYIYTKFEKNQGAWSSYVQTELLPRLHGFELMMAPYTIAHLKLALTLKETNIDSFDQRLGVYLTNTLEEGKITNPDLFNQLGVVGAITTESVEANKIKNETPIMVIIGNPPYSGVSSNMTEYASKLINKYKVEPGGTQKLQERKHWLNDDYVKFIAFAENMVEKSGEGVVAMITNHGYLDNPTFRGMRWHLAKTFSTIYCLDLHGNAKKQEVSPDGSPDKNVFDIQQGVSIILAIKKKGKNAQAQVYRTDLWGSRKSKFETLRSNKIGDFKWDKLTLDSESYSFTQNLDSTLKREYSAYISITDLFLNDVTGVVTMGDSFAVNQNRTELSARIQHFLIEDTLTENALNEKYGLGKNYAKWVLKNKAKGLDFNEDQIISFSYRPFDTRYIYYDQNFVWRTRQKVMSHMNTQDNLALVARKQFPSIPTYFFISKHVTADGYIRSDNKGSESVFPLFLYPNSDQSSFSDEKTSNLNKQFTSILLSNVTDKNIATPENIFDYVYASLHSPNYREKYKDFLKSDFPRIPPAKDTICFWQMVELGCQLRQIHLLEEKALGTLTINFPVTGTNTVDKIEFKSNKVYINQGQYFEGITREVFDFQIGSYKPAEKWLKDRKGRTLTYDDIEHYQKIIVAQGKSIEIMNKINEVVK